MGAGMGQPRAAKPEARGRPAPSRMPTRVPRQRHRLSTPNFVSGEYFAFAACVPSHDSSGRPMLCGPASRFERSNYRASSAV